MKKIAPPLSDLHFIIFKLFISKFLEFCILIPPPLIVIDSDFVFPFKSGDMFVVVF
jgi:hypothetical protein